MRILGIDPGIRRTGYGIIESKGGRLELIDFGTIQPPVDGTMGERLSTIYDDVSELIRTHEPASLAIETSFFGVNAKSAMILGQARAAALLAGAHAKLIIGEYAPRKIKAATTGSGRASKEQVQHMVQGILNMQQLPTPLDASDALAIAICHHQQSTLLELGR